MTVCVCVLCVSLCPVLVSAPDAPSPHDAVGHAAGTAPALECASRVPQAGVGFAVGTHRNMYATRCRCQTPGSCMLCLGFAVEIDVDTLLVVPLPLLTTAVGADAPPLPPPRPGRVPSGTRMSEDDVIKVAAMHRASLEAQGQVCHRARVIVSWRGVGVGVPQSCFRTRCVAACGWLSTDNSCAHGPSM